MVVGASWPVLQHVFSHPLRPSAPWWMHRGDLSAGPAGPDSEAVMSLKKASLVMLVELTIQKWWNFYFSRFSFPQGSVILWRSGVGTKLVILPLLSVGPVLLVSVWNGAI